MKTTPPIYQYVFWIVCGLLILSFSVSPQRTSPLPPTGLSSLGSTQKVLASAPLTTDHFDQPAAPSTDFAIIGAADEHFDLNGKNYLSKAGAAYFYELGATGQLTNEQRVVAQNRSARDLFGWATAISGDYAVVTAPYEDHDVIGESQVWASGSAYIFARDASGRWIEKQKIVASDRSLNDQFGFSAAISGNYIIIGAVKSEDKRSPNRAKPNAGAAYIFEKDKSGQWVEVQKLIPEDAQTGVGFGYDVSIFENLAIVRTRGAEFNSNNSEPIGTAGAAYIFERNPSGFWQQQLKIDNPQQTLLCLEKLF